MIGKEGSVSAAEHPFLDKNLYPVWSGDMLELGEIGGATGIDYNYYWENFRPENDEAYQTAPQPKSHLIVKEK